MEWGDKIVRKDLRDSDTLGVLEETIKIFPNMTFLFVKFACTFEKLHLLRARELRSTFVIRGQH